MDERKPTEEYGLSNREYTKTSQNPRRRYLTEPTGKYVDEQEMPNMRPLHIIISHTMILITSYPTAGQYPTERTLYQAVPWELLPYVPKIRPLTRYHFVDVLVWHTMVRDFERRRGAEIPSAIFSTEVHKYPKRILGE